jgi:carboxypeptidase PM20D1
MAFLRWVSITLALLILVFAWNALTFSTEKVALKPLLDGSEIDKLAVATRLSKGIQFATISHMDREKKDPQVFKDFHTFLKQSFPNVDSSLELEMVSELSLLYRWKGTDSSLKPIMLISHQDVVPVDSETLERWIHEPFSGAISDNIIWGRGAVDIKSGLLGILEATENLLTKGFQPKRDVYLAFGHDEEIGGNGGAKKIAQILRDRKLNFKFILDEGGSIVGDGIIQGVERPIALVGIAEKGYVSLQLEATDVGGHSSMPPKHTALGVIAQALVNLEASPFPANMAYSRAMFENIGPAMAGLEKAIFANLWITEPLVERILSGSKTANASIRTTTAVTMAKGSSKDNILPSEASAVINFRIMPGETIETVLAHAKSVINDENVDVTIKGGFSVEPSSVSISDNESFLQIKGTIHRVTQDENLIVSPYLTVGATDARHYEGLSNSIYRFAFNRPLHCFVLPV